MRPETILLRQVHPNFFPSGQLSSQAFLPFPKDDGKLSTYDGAQISASDSHRHYTQTLDQQSSCVWGVSNSEVTSAGLSSIADPLLNFPSHVLIDFTGHPEKDFRKLAKRLKALALSRGCLYMPD